MFSEARFSVLDVLSLLGLAQCLYLLTYMVFRAGNLRQAVLPLLYFSTLACGFASDFIADHLHFASSGFGILQWMAWYGGPPLGVVLIAGVIDLSSIRFRNFWPLLALPLSAIAAAAYSLHGRGCGEESCGVLFDWLVIVGLGIGLSSIATLWPARKAIRTLHADREGVERYWLVVMLLVLNLAFLGVMLAGLTPLITPLQTQAIKTLLGLGLVYLAGTTMFRIYPHRFVSQTPVAKTPVLSAAEREMAARIEQLLKFEKIYQEPSYNRGDLARELGLPEASVSRIVNAYFGKSFPQLLNEFRINDAKYLLQQDGQPIKMIAEEVGFNSIASFNRVFREVTGVTPSAFRDQLRSNAPDA